MRRPSIFASSRLPAERRRNVGSALEEHFKTKPKYPAEVTRGALAVIEATPALGRPDDLPMFTIDVATDSVISAIYRVAQAIQRGLVSTVVPLSAEQQAQLDAAVLLETTWFPDGIGFLRDAVGVQYAAMGAIRSSLSDPEGGPALKAFGLGRRSSTSSPMPRCMRRSWGSRARSSPRRRASRAIRATSGTMRS